MQEVVEVESGHCKWADVTKKTTTKHYAAEYEIFITGNVLMHFNEAVQIPGQDGKADRRLISVNDLLTFAQVSIHCACKFIFSPRIASVLQFMLLVLASLKALDWTAYLPWCIVPSAM